VQDKNTPKLFPHQGVVSALEAYANLQKYECVVPSEL